MHLRKANKRTGGNAMTAAEISAADISEDQHRAQLRRAVIASTVGTTIEGTISCCTDR